MKTITVDINLLSEVIEIDVSYFIDGENIPSSLNEPAEYEELVITSITREIDDTDVNIISFFSVAELNEIENIVIDYLTN